MTKDNVVQFSDYASRNGRPHLARDSKDKNVIKLLDDLKNGKVYPVSPFPGMDKPWTKEEEEALDKALLEAFPNSEPKK